jgi:hypothetical protein
MLLTHLRALRLKHKIKNNPFLGEQDVNGNYYYKEKGYTIIYKIKQLPKGRNGVTWIYYKRRLTGFEDKILKIKRRLDKIFLYQKWNILFRPIPVVILVSSLIIFYFGIKQNSLRRIELFRQIVAQMTGLNPESVKYTDKGWFEISGQKKALDGRLNPLVIKINPLRSLFLPEGAIISRWNTELNKYIDYSVSINSKGSVCLEKKEGHFYGRREGHKIVWDEPPDTIRKVLGEDIIIEDGALKIVDR